MTDPLLNEALHLARAHWPLAGLLFLLLASIGHALTRTEEETGPGPFDDGTFYLLILPPLMCYGLLCLAQWPLRRLMRARARVPD